MSDLHEIAEAVRQVAAVEAVERPMPFTGPMVRAVLPGRKTHTRRLRGLELVNENPDQWAVIRPTQKEEPKVDGGIAHFPGATARSWLGLKNPAGVEDYGYICLTCPYGKVGDRLWVREGIRHLGDGASVYAADLVPTPADAWPWKRNYLPPMHCPRGLSRLLLEIVSIRVERLQDISSDDCLAEGIQWHAGMQGYHVEDGTHFHAASAIESYRSLWESINGDDSWAANPWVWVIEFRRVKP